MTTRESECLQAQLYVVAIGRTCVMLQCAGMKTQSPTRPSCCAIEQPAAPSEASYPMQDIQRALTHPTGKAGCQMLAASS